MPETGGQRLKRAIHIARARAGIVSDMRLSILADVHYDTLMNWYSDRTVPRPNEVRKIAVALAEPFANLMAAYEGRDPEPPPLMDRISDLAEAVQALAGEIRRDRIEDEKRRVQQDAMNQTMLEALGAIASGQGRAETPRDTSHESHSGTGR